MSKAHLSAWYNYNAGENNTYNQIYYDYFVENFHRWCDQVDAVYLVDVNWNFTEEDKKRLTNIKKEVVFIKASKPNGILNDYFKEVVDQIKEDLILFMDNDCFIYDPQGIKVWFDTLEDHDCVITLSEGNSLREAVFNKYPKLKVMEKPGIWLNHFLVTKKWLSTINWDLKPYSPFPVGTYLPELDYTTKEGDWGEYCCRLIWQMMASNWVELNKVHNQGFHHFHWGNFASILLTLRARPTTDYENFIREQDNDRFLRVMAWYLTIDTKGKYLKETKAVIEDLLKFNTKDL